MPEGIQSLGRLLIIAGAVMMIAGLVLYFSPRLPFIWKLPGDILVQKKNFTFYFPLATSILISVVVTLLLWIFGRR